MTIPQGDNRGSQSVSERRKVTFAGDNPPAGSLPTKANTAHSTLGEDTDTPDLASPVTEPHTVKEKPDLLGAISALPADDKAEKSVKDLRNHSLYEQDHLEVNVKVVSQRKSEISPLPLLNFLKVDAACIATERNRKLSLNLTKPYQKQAAHLQLEKTRRYSQPQKSYYQKVPLEDPSPPSPCSQIFTLPEFEDTSLKQRPPFRRYKSEVQSYFGDKDKRYDSRRAVTSSTQESSGGKKVLLWKQKPLASSNTSSSRSLDDLTFGHHGVVWGKSRGVSTNLSVSSEDLSTSRQKRVTSTGGSGGHHPRRQPGDPHPSPGSPSRCCLVSVARVPMAAATSHLTLDSDYQTVRLAVLGAPGVGKSSIVKQFVMQQFTEEYVPTEQRQIFCPAVIINEHLYEVRIIDCPYIPYFPVNSLYEWTDFRGYGLRNATAYVLVYDITSEESFEYIKSLRLQILESRNKHDVPIFVVGNKHDLAEERGVPRREVREIANLVKKQWKCGYIECSAKYNWHIMLLFKELMKTVDYIDYGHKPTSMRVQDALRRNRCLIL